MRHKLKSLICAALIAGSAISSASALEYSYQADLYDNYFYTPTSSNHALDLNNASDSGGSTVVVGSASMEKGTNQSGAAGNSPVIPVGSYIDPWGQNVDTQIETGATLNGIADKAFSSLVGDYALPLPTLASSSFTTSCATGVPVLVTPTFVSEWTSMVTPLYVTTPVVQPASTVYSNGLFTARDKVTTTDGHFGEVSIGSRKLFANVYPGASSASMKKGAGHVDGTSVWDGNIALCGHNRGSWPYFSQLKNVQLGDVITYKTSLGVRTYRVTYAGRISATDTSVLKPSFDNRITMLTCVANEPAYRYCVIGQQIVG